MNPRRVLTTRICHLSLRVTELRRSVAFYRDLFGAVLAISPTANGHAHLNIATGDPALRSFAIVLVEVLPTGMELIGLDHFGLEVSAETEVTALFNAAIALGASATQPRIYNGHFQTFIFDPDGYKIEVLAG